LTKGAALLAIILCFVLSASLALAVPDGGVSYYDLDNNVLDSWGSNDGTQNGGSFVTSYPSFNNTGDGATHSFDSGGTGYINLGSSSTLNPSSISVSLWFNLQVATDNTVLFARWTGSPDYIQAYKLWYDLDADNGLRWGVKTSSGTNDGIAEFLLNTSQWYHIVATYNETSGDTKVYLDGHLIASDNTYSGSILSQSIDTNLLSQNNGERIIDGLIDEVKVFNRELTQEEVTNLYNCGNITCGVSPTTYTVHTIDLYDNTNLSNVNVTFAPGCWNLTDATGAATITNETCSGVSGTLSWTATKNGYFSASGTVAPNNTATANMYEGVVNITGIYRLVDQALLNASSDWSVETTGGKTYNGNATDYPSNIYLTNGTNTLTLQHAGDYYDKDFMVNITAPQATTTNVSGVYDAVATITAKNVFTNVTISNFTINASNTTYSYESSHSTTNGTLYLPTIQGSNLFLLIDAPGYAYANTTLNATNATPEHEFLLYTMNSIYINIYDADTGLLITQNISVTVSGNTTEETKTTTTGHVYFDLLPDGVYNVKLSGSNYSLRTYSVTVAERSTQTLNAYLSAYTQTVIFTVRDDDTKNSIEGCSLSMYRLVNSSWNVVESKTSDITGRAQFTYTPNIKYRFVTTCEGYIDKEFYLDPIIFSSYNIDMEKTIVLPEDQDYYGVSVTFSPNYFENDKAYNFSITFQSPSGLLSIYNYSITYPGGNASNSGNNAIGETFTTSFNITNATYPSYVVVNYSYNTSIGSWRSFSYRYLVEETIPSHSILELRENDYGLGDFTKALIAVGITIIVAGVAMVVNMMAGAVLGIMVIGYFLYIGFLPLWSVLISFLVIILIIARRSS